MLKRTIKYTNFNDEEVEEVFYFNISKPELIEMEVEYDGGLTGFIKRIVESNSGRDIIMQFKEFILRSYGQRSDDGKRFIKNDQLREEFSQSAAYHVLFMELATSAEKAAEFLMGTLPKDMQGDLEKAIAANAAPST